MPEVATSKSQQNKKNANKYSHLKTIPIYTLLYPHRIAEKRDVLFLQPEDLNIFVENGDPRDACRIESFFQIEVSREGSDGSKTHKFEFAFLNLLPGILVKAAIDCGEHFNNFQIGENFISWDSYDLSFKILLEGNVYLYIKNKDNLAERGTCKVKVKGGIIVCLLPVNLKSLEFNCGELNCESNSNNAHQLMQKIYIIGDKFASKS